MFNQGLQLVIGRCPWPLSYRLLSLSLSLQASLPQSLGAGRARRGSPRPRPHRHHELIGWPAAIPTTYCKRIATRDTWNITVTSRAHSHSQTNLKHHGSLWVIAFEFLGAINIFLKDYCVNKCSHSGSIHGYQTNMTLEQHKGEVMVSESGYITVHTDAALPVFLLTHTRLLCGQLSVPCCQGDMLPCPPDSIPRFFSSWGGKFVCVYSYVCLAVCQARC